MVQPGNTGACVLSSRISTSSLFLTVDGSRSNPLSISFRFNSDMNALGAMTIYNNATIAIIETDRSCKLSALQRLLYKGSLDCFGDKEIRCRVAGSQLSCRNRIHWPTVSESY